MILNKPAAGKGSSTGAPFPLRGVKVVISMHICYIIAIIFAVVWLVFKLIEAEKSRKAELEKLNKSDDSEI